MRKPIFLGDEELKQAHCRAGHIISNCSMLEGSISYLEWQLTAFSLALDHPSATPAALQTARRGERKTWDMYASLEVRLTRVTKAFEAPHVAAAIKRNPQIRAIRKKWETLRERARALGKQRSLIGHTFLAYTDGKVVRQIGRPWKEQIRVTREDDEALITNLGKLTHEIGELTSELGRLLPFADADQILTA